jgi:hypothetical protein
MDATEIAAQVNDTDGFDAKPWTRVAGKERVYVSFGPKLNGGKNWHGGCGWSGWLDCTTGEWRDESWAGAATRKAYSDRIEALQADIGK